MDGEEAVVVLPWVRRPPRCDAPQELRQHLAAQGYGDARSPARATSGGWAGWQRPDQEVAGGVKMLWRMPRLHVDAVLSQLGRDGRRCLLVTTVNLPATSCQQRRHTGEPDTTDAHGMCPTLLGREESLQQLVVSLFGHR